VDVPIKAKFDEIAEKTSTPETADLVREIGAMMQDRFAHTNSIHVQINTDLGALRTEFQELSSLLIARLKSTERLSGDQMENMIDRVHTLSNRFMAVEGKVDEMAELFDFKLEEISNAVKNDRSDTSSE
jgi:hypothetical protein